MRILGIRVDPQATRSALLDYDGQVSTLLNASSESRLLYPADVVQPGDKADWVYRELQRILHSYRDLESACIKTNEYMARETKPRRESAYLEGAVLLFCKQNRIPVTVKVYASLGTRSSDVQEDAERRVGRTTRYWNSKMADAVVAAWSAAGD